MPNSPMNDDSLFERFSQGDPEAINQIYREAYPFCARFIKANSGTEEDAKDMFHDALMILHQKVRKDDFELRVALKTYLFSIVRKLWLKKLRNQRSQGQAFDIEETAEEWLTFSDEELKRKIEKEEKLEKAKGALDRLGEECRELLLDYYFGKMKMKEIAEKLNLSEKYVRLKKYRCMQRLIDDINSHLDPNE